jgi:hypothetical protein
MGPAVARAWRADTGHVRNGARAVPTMRAEILARPPQPRPLLLRPLRRPRSQGQVCHGPRCSACDGPERPQVRAVRRTDQGRALDDALLLGALPGRRAPCWRLDRPAPGQRSPWGAGLQAATPPRGAHRPERRISGLSWRRRRFPLAICVLRSAALPQDQPDRAPQHFESARAVGGSRLLSPLSGGEPGPLPR